MKKQTIQLLVLAMISAATIGCSQQKKVQEIDYSLIPYALCQDGGCFMGYIDTQGNPVILPQFEDGWAFSDELAIVRKNGLCGFINKEGAFVIPAIYDNAAMFFDERAFVHEPGQPITCINTNGETVFELTDCIEAGFFSEGLAPVCNASKKWGYVNTAGEQVIAAQFDEAYCFAEGCARVKLGKLYGFINPNGQFIINPQYGEANDFSCGLAAVRGTEYRADWKYINKEGKCVLTNDRYVNINFSEDLMCNWESRHHMVIRNVQGDSLAATQAFDAVGPFSEGLCAVTLAKSSGFIDKTGLLVINPIYDNTGHFHEGVAIIKQNGKYGLVDKKGQLVVEPKYDFIGSAPHFRPQVNEGLVKNTMREFWCKLDISKKRRNR